jgi:hypothetical protein
MKIYREFDIKIKKRMQWVVCLAYTYSGVQVSWLMMVENERARMVLRISFRLAIVSPIAFAFLSTALAAIHFVY